MGLLSPLQFFLGFADGVGMPVRSAGGNLSRVGRAGSSVIAQVSRAWQPTVGAVSCRRTEATGVVKPQTGQVAEPRRTVPPVTIHRFAAFNRFQSQFVCPWAVTSSFNATLRFAFLASQRERISGTSARIRPFAADRPRPQVRDRVAPSGSFG